jgi:hypothetical protein
MSDRLCVCREPIAFCPHLGAFTSYEEKLAYYVNYDRTETRLKLVAAGAQAKQMTILAKTFGIAKKLPPELQEALQLVCDGADKLDSMPVASLITYAKIAALVTKQVCDAMGVE